MPELERLRAGHAPAVLAFELANRASQKVLTKAGFVAVGPADPAHIGGKPGTWYRRDLVP